MEEKGVKLMDEAVLVLGKEKFSCGTGRTYYIGECAKSTRGKAPWLKGCPPANEEIFEFLLDNI
jgi:hypothetical protein